MKRALPFVAVWFLSVLASVIVMLGTRGLDRAEVATLRARAAKLDAFEAAERAGGHLAAARIVGLDLEGAFTEWMKEDLSPSRAAKDILEDQGPASGARKPSGFDPEAFLAQPAASQHAGKYRDLFDAPAGTSPARSARR